jgi:hypothetical protein
MINAYGSTASIDKNTNVVYSTTEGRWGLIPEGSLIRMADDHGFYTINSTQEVFYIEKFSKNDKTSIVVNKNVGYNILPGDIATLSSKQWKLSTVSVTKGGQGFKKGDVISIEGGRPSVNSHDGKINQAILTVKHVTKKKGEVLEVNISDQGNYLIKPKLNYSADFGVGEGLGIKLTFEESPERHLVEMSVNRVARNSTDSIIYFDSLVPTSMEYGKVATKKHQAHLASEYFGKSKYVDSYEIVNSFTPYLKMPLLARNSLSPETFYNRSLIILDERIKNLEKKLNIN